MIKIYLFLTMLILSGCENTGFLLWKPEKAGPNRIYLTFDDGPNDIATKEVLKVLEKHNVRATFFLIGKNVERDPVLAKTIADKGHLIGNHGYGLGNTLFLQSEKAVVKNLAKTNKIIFEASGKQPKYFRPPNGLITASMQKACEKLNMTAVGVHVFVRDSFKSNAHTIAGKVIDKIEMGEYIVVLHDGFGTFKKDSRRVVAVALEIIIENLNERGF